MKLILLGAPGAGRALSPPVFPKSTAFRHCHRRYSPRGNQGGNRARQVCEELHRRRQAGSGRGGHRHHPG